MKIAIHHRNNSFSESWIEYCKKNNVPYKIVNCYDSDIIEQLHDCNAVMWHHHHTNPKDHVFAKQLLFSLEQAGIKVFPNFKTGWHFDDKLGQKYLTEALNIPAVPSHAFFTRSEALNWAAKTSYPKVFKLRGGAGSSNVLLVQSHSSAVKLINKAFGPGFPQYQAYNALKERIRKYRQGSTGFKSVAKGIVRLFVKPAYAQLMGREKGYAYFQDFIPENDHDIRVVIIGNKCFAVKRMTRENDFKASGSGIILFSKDNFSDKIINQAFEIAEQVGSQCLAIDFVFHDGVPLLVEMSYGYSFKVYEKCEGYWDRQLNWYPGTFKSQEWVIENLINS